MSAGTLHSAIAAVCPIHGVAIVDPADKSTWRIDFKGEATAQERAAAQGVVASFAGNTTAPAPARDLAAEIDALKGALAAKGIVSDADIAAARPARIKE